MREKPGKTSKSYFDIQESRNQKEKAAVARFIVERYFQEGDSILVDAGSSLWPVAKWIVEKCSRNPEQTHYTIMTHNYKAFELLVDAPASANMNIILAGGRYDQDLNALFGVQTASNYEKFFPRTVVIGVSGVRSDIGLFCHGNTEELQVKELIFKKSCNRRIIVADYQKLGTLDSFLFGRSTDMRVNTDHCILVTSKPPGSAPKAERDRFRDEVETLKKIQQVTVEEVDTETSQASVQSKNSRPRARVANA